MSTTITLAGSIAFAQTYNGFKSLTIGTNSEPAITAMNIIIQTILGAPFIWNWNRASTTFTTTAGTQDYTQAISSFGFIEKASYKIPAASITNVAVTGGVATYTATNTFQAADVVTITGLATTALNITKQSIVSATSTTFTVNVNTGNVSSTPDTGTATVGTTSEITEISNILGTGNDLGSPTKIAPQVDDNAGNITWRLMPAPDRVYTIEVIFQKRIPALIAATTGTWAPIPDHYSYIYQWGFLALMLAYNGDVRWTQASQKFVSGLLGAAEGLTEEQKNVFQNAWLNTITQQQSREMSTQQGVSARGV